MRTAISILNVAVAFFFAFLPAPAAAQTKPEFSDYKAAQIYLGPHASPKLTLPEAYRFRTRLKAGAAMPVNFAGHYILVKWGCGTNCVTGAIIDAVDGSTYPLPFSICCADWTTPEDFDPIAIRADSRMILFTGQLNEEGANGEHYYEWRERGLVLISNAPITDPTKATQTPELATKPATKPEPQALDMTKYERMDMCENYSFGIMLIVSLKSGGQDKQQNIRSIFAFNNNIETQLTLLKFGREGINKIIDSIYSENTEKIDNEIAYKTAKKDCNSGYLDYYDGLPRY